MITQNQIMNWLVNICRTNAFTRIESNQVTSSWKDAYVSSDLSSNVSEFIQVPTFGCFFDRQEIAVLNKKPRFF